MSRAALLVALLAGCAGAGDESDLRDLQAVAGDIVETWLPPEHPAAAAQARWGLALPCRDLQVLELQPVELAAFCRSDETDLRSCAPAGRCTVALSSELAGDRRELVLTHELGHVFAPFAGHVQQGCPERAPGEHLMCSYGPASGSPVPTLADFDLVLP